MKEKIKTIVLWIILIWLAMGFIDSFISAVMFVLYLPGVSPQNPLITIFALLFFSIGIVKLQKKLGVPNLLKKK